MKILNFGSCNIDHVYTVEHIVRPGETETSAKLEIFPGGKGLNQSIAIAKAGCHVYHAGCIGNDAKLLLDILTDSGVDTSYIKILDTKNGHAIIQVDPNGENSIVLYPGSNNMITREFIDHVLENFDAGDFILLQNEINNIEYIIEKAFNKGLRIVLNPSPFKDELRSIDIRKISYLILNEIEAEAMTGAEDTEEMLMYFKKNHPGLRVVLTLGSMGCIYMEHEALYRQSIFEVEVQDTTAAGDTFTGYFIAEISKGAQCQDALKTAACASAIAVSRKGAAPSIPLADEVAGALLKLKEKHPDRYQ